MKGRMLTREDFDVYAGVNLGSHVVLIIGATPDIVAELLHVSMQGEVCVATFRLPFKVQKWDIGARALPLSYFTDELEIDIKYLPLVCRWWPNAKTQEDVDLFEAMDVLNREPTLFDGILDSIRNNGAGII